jgi:hypothetical protein
VGSHREEMSAQEEESRERKFRDKLLRKSFTGQESAIGSGRSSMNGLGRGLQIDVSAKHSEMELKVEEEEDDDDMEIEHLSGAGKVGASASARRNEDSDDEVEAISEDDFNSMMDTLAMQPKAIRAESTEIGNYTLNMSTITADIANSLNGISMAFHSEKGARKEQEDRCVLHPDVLALARRKGEGANHRLGHDFDQVSIACIFDGHSGSYAANLLVDRLCRHLLANDMFVRGQWKDAITETFRKVDEEVIGTFQF